MVHVEVDGREYFMKTRIVVDDAQRACARSASPHCARWFMKMIMPGSRARARGSRYGQPGVLGGPSPRLTAAAAAYGMWMPWLRRRARIFSIFIQGAPFHDRLPVLEPVSADPAVPQ
jgi:hypothetical protein